MKLFAIIAVIAGAMIGAFALFGSAQQAKASPAAEMSHHVTVYKSPTCGCCANYVTYLESLGYRVEVKDVEDIDVYKRQYKVPQNLYSCHTTVVDNGGYVVEGHVPDEAYIKLLQERPKISGIGMAGMPHGSPGMPGSHGAGDIPFDIRQFGDDGTTRDYLKL